MFQKASAPHPEASTGDRPRASFSWAFRRAQVAPEAAPAPAAEAEFAANAMTAGFEAFGRCGLQLGGLHRDQQWVGAWGGRC